jgi:hypothetical protein
VVEWPAMSEPQRVEWRRRESNANEENRNDLSVRELAISCNPSSTQGPRTGVSESHEVTAEAGNVPPLTVDYIATAWPQLQPHVREAIVTLIDGALNALTRDEAAVAER